MQLLLSQRAVSCYYLLLIAITHTPLITICMCKNAAPFFCLICFSYACESGYAKIFQFSLVFCVCCLLHIFVWLLLLLVVIAGSCCCCWGHIERQKQKLAALISFAHKHATYVWQGKARQCKAREGVPQKGRPCVLHSAFATLIKRSGRCCHTWHASDNSRASVCRSVFLSAWPGISWLGPVCLSMPMSWLAWLSWNPWFMH